MRVEGGLCAATLLEWRHERVISLRWNHGNNRQQLPLERAPDRQRLILLKSSILSLALGAHWAHWALGE